MDNVFRFENGTSLLEEQESGQLGIELSGNGQVGVLLNPIRNKMKRDLEDIIYLDVFNETLGDDPDDVQATKIKSEDTIVTAVADYVHLRRQ